MKNFVQMGDTLRLTSPYDRLSGQGALVGGIFGVATIDVVSGVVADFAIEGVFDLTKVTGVDWTEGQMIYWDNSNKRCTTVAAGMTPIGTAVKGDTDAMALSAATTGRVKLRGGMAALGIAFGQQTTVAAADTIVTGLSSVVCAVASYDTDPADANDFVSVTIGDQAGTPAAGSIILKTWKSADGADVTPVAASAFSKKVNWIAIGTR